jgi:hypothetical protein
MAASSPIIDGLDEIDLRRRVSRIQPVARPQVGLLVFPPPSLLSLSLLS